MENKYKEKYKREVWKISTWKGTKRENVKLNPKLVKRDTKGRFISVLKIEQRSYGSGVYEVGLTKEGKVKTRHKIMDSQEPFWKEERKRILKNTQVYRCSLALNDVPYKGSDYYGFRIVAYSRNKGILFKVYPQKMYKKLIEFIEKCLKYRSDEFWFSHYLNYMGKIAPEISNASIRDSGKFELLWTKRKTGTIMRQEHGELTQL